MSAAVAVTIVAAGDARPDDVGVVSAAASAGRAIDGLVRDLEREVVDVTVTSLVHLLDSELERSVVLVWFPGAVETTICARLAGWAGGRRPRVGLIAWAREGDRSSAEVALDEGFDDVVVGPCSTREIAARIRAVHRRVHWGGAQRAGRLRFAGLMLDTDGHELWVDGRTVTLTSTELAVVRALIRAGGKTLTRTELLDRAWGSANFEVTERAVDNVILRLRRKLGRADVIQTVRGVGFRLAAD